MAKRDWDNLDPKCTYIISAKDGWSLSMNGDGTVTLKHGSGHPASAVAATATASMTINPDPGSGNKFPP